MRLFQQGIAEMKGKLLPHSLACQGSILWALDPVINLKPEDMLSIRLAFARLDAYIWHASTGGERSLRIRDHLRALGEHKFLSKNLVLQRTQTWTSNDRRHYSDISKITDNAWAEILSLFSQSTAGSDSALCFLPEGTDAVVDWSRALVGIEWAWLCRGQSARRSIPLDVENIWSCYIDAIITIGGTACVPWRDTDSLLGLSFVGPLELVDLAVGHLRAEGHEFVTSDEMKRVLKRGISMAPAD